MTKRIISLLLLVAVLATMLPAAYAQEKEKTLDELFSRINPAKTGAIRLDEPTDITVSDEVRQTKSSNCNVVMPSLNMWNQSAVKGQTMLLDILLINYGYYAQDFYIWVFQGDDFDEDDLVAYYSASFSRFSDPLTNFTLSWNTAEHSVGEYTVCLFTGYGDEIVSDIYFVPVTITSQELPLSSITFLNSDTDQPVYSAKILPGESLTGYISYYPYNATTPNRKIMVSSTNPDVFTVDNFGGLITIYSHMCGDGIINVTSAGKTITIYATSHIDHDGNNICDDCAKMLLYDVPATAWFYNAVEYVVRRGLFNGVAPNTFAPDSSMTRAMVVTVLWRYEGSPYAESSTFSDVPDGSWYDQAVSWAAANEVVNGVGDNKFNPDGLVTREQLATIIYRYCKNNKINSFARADLATFPDGSKVSGWAYEAMSWAVAVGLIGGMEDTAGGALYLKPEGNATRAQVATILMRFIENVADNLVEDLIVLITESNYSPINDESYNQAAWEGITNWCEAHDKSYTYYMPSEDSDYARIEAIDQAVRDGATTIVLNGFLFGTALTEVQELYPDVNFIGLDIYESDMVQYAAPNYEPTYYAPTANTALVAYQEEQAGYLAGYAAVRMGYRNLGFLGGMAVPAVVRYGYGFVQGANDAAMELGVTDEVEIDFVYANQFYGDANITAYLCSLFEQGMEVVFACGGGVYTSAAEAAAMYNGKVIGVDLDQAAMIDGWFGEGITLTSAMKNLSFTVEYLLDSIYVNNTWSNYGGTCTRFGVQDGGKDGEGFVMLPESTQFNESFTAYDYVTVWNELADGTVTVSDDIESKPSVSITVNYLGNIH